MVMIFIIGSLIIRRKWISDTKESHVIPVECKAGNHVKAKSMMVYMEKYNPSYAIRISTRNFGMAKGIKSVPLYSVFCI